MSLLAISLSLKMNKNVSLQVDSETICSYMLFITLECWTELSGLMFNFMLLIHDLPYAAKFYDCCGAEDPDASGCTTSFHVSYDDD